GGTLYVTVFMVTDPVSAPNRKPAQYAYGFVIGFLIVLLRWRGIFVAAATFAVLLGNIVGPLLDIAAAAYAEGKKARRLAVAGTATNKPKGAPASEGQGKDDASKHGHSQTTRGDRAAPAEGGRT
ncbi:MAG: RnfABCDGE type electron transport complex subunit D, partial [Phycisphaerae bacterium]|nr:RnfABCDGE type electron transport complex subunit D [Phycisphaerae bacterium]